MASLQSTTSGHELFLIDCVGEGKSHEALQRDLRTIRPDVVGISSYSLSMVDCRLVARAVREISATAHVCLGGHHPTAFPFEAAGIADFDSIVVGEGEVAFAELVHALEQGRDITTIAGVYTRDSIASHRGKPCRDPRLLGGGSVPAAYIEDVDALPLPNREWVRHIPYVNPIGPKRRMTTLISSRGCPFKCTYCDVPFKRYRPMSTARVLDDVEACLRQGFDELHFYDDLFSITPARLHAFCDEVERRGLRFAWDFRGRVDGVDRESLARARRAGCWMISFGVETGTDDGLASIRKGTTTKAVKQAFAWCRELGIVTVADFMIGFPFERTADDVRRNVDFVLAIDPDYLLVSILMLLPHTEIYREAVEKGIIDPGKWTEFARDPRADCSFALDYWTEHLSATDLLRLRKEAYRRFYLRPRYMLRTALSVRSVAEFARKARGLLALVKKGILSRHP